MKDISAGAWIAWSIVGVIVLQQLYYLFLKGMSAARKDRAIKTGDASGLTIEDKAENRAAFARELEKPSPAPGSTMHTAKACATLGVVLVGAAMVAMLVFDVRSGVASLALCVGLLLFMLGGAVAIGGGK